MSIIDDIRKAKAEATSGPWVIRKISERMEIRGNIHQVTDMENYPSAFVPAWDEPKDGEVDGTVEALSNARLIALAPQMAEICEAAEVLADAMQDLPDGPYHECYAALAAYRKATE